MGSEMCIRDRYGRIDDAVERRRHRAHRGRVVSSLPASTRLRVNVSDTDMSAAPMKAAVIVRLETHRAHASETHATHARENS